MWLRASTDSGVGEPMHASLRAAVPGGRPRLVGLLLPVVAGVLLAACSSGPPKPTEEPPQPETSAPPAAGKSGAAPAGKAGAPGTPGAPGAAPPVPVAVTARGKADFDRAVGFMRAGNTTEAELEFKQVALQFPQLSSPYVNLGFCTARAAAWISPKLRSKRPWSAMTPVPWPGPSLVPRSE